MKIENQFIYYFKIIFKKTIKFFLFFCKKSFTLFDLRGFDTPYHLHLKMQAVLLLFVALSASAPNSLANADRSFNTTQYSSNRFRNFLEEFGIILTAQEFRERLPIFQSNAALVAKHNANPNRTSTLAINEWSDLTVEEWGRKVGIGAGKRYFKARTNSKRETLPIRVASVPDEVDWRRRNAVTSVKNQGDCGSCYAFSAAGAIEGAWALSNVSNHTLVNFSVQQILDCSRGYGGNAGCAGGKMDDVFRFVIAEGLSTEDAYPYTASDERCKYRGGSPPRFHLTSFLMFQPITRLHS